MLVEKEKFLNNNLCDFFIKYHNDNTHLHDPKHGNTSIVCCEYQDEHIDFDHHTFTSILYLNDDFEGGQTVVGDKIIKPEKGKIIFFNGNQIKHKVLPIESGTRYTNPTWYITQKEEEILNEQT